MPVKPQRSRIHGEQSEVTAGQYVARPDTCWGDEGNPRTFQGDEGNLGALPVRSKYTGFFWKVRERSRNEEQSSHDNHINRSNHFSSGPRRRGLVPGNVRSGRLLWNLAHPVWVRQFGFSVGKEATMPKMSTGEWIFFGSAVLTGIAMDIWSHMY